MSKFRLRLSPLGSNTLYRSAATKCSRIAITALFVSATLQGQAPPPEAKVVNAGARSSSSDLDVLIRARQHVGLFFEQSTNVVCGESILQTTIGKNGKTTYREESKYDYQLESSLTGGKLKLQESRDVRKQAFRDPARTLLITKGFVSLLLIAHPQYESSYVFEPAGDEYDGSVTLLRFNFRPVPGASSPAALQLRGKNYPLPLSGSLWINKETGAITRMTAAVDSSLSDLGLVGMQSDIHYALVQFHDPDEAYWMPLSATIELQTPLQHWKNVHRFTGYRRFRGSIEIEGLKDQWK